MEAGIKQTLKAEAQPRGRPVPTALPSSPVRDGHRPGFGVEGWHFRHCDCAFIKQYPEVATSCTLRFKRQFLPILIIFKGHPHKSFSSRFTRAPWKTAALTLLPRRDFQSRAESHFYILNPDQYAENTSKRREKKVKATDAFAKLLLHCP